MFCGFFSRVHLFVFASSWPVHLKRLYIFIQWTIWRNIFFSAVMTCLSLPRDNNYNYHLYVEKKNNSNKWSPLKQFEELTNRIRCLSKKKWQTARLIFCFTLNKTTPNAWIDNTQCLIFSFAFIVCLSWIMSIFDLEYYWNTTNDMIISGLRWAIVFEQARWIIKLR